MAVVGTVEDYTSTVVNRYDLNDDATVTITVRRRSDGQVQSTGTFPATAAQQDLVARLLANQQAEAARNAALTKLANNLPDLQGLMDYYDANWPTAAASLNSFLGLGAGATAADVRNATRLEAQILLAVMPKLRSLAEFLQQFNQVVQK